jgi:hypothetical protein
MAKIINWEDHQNEPVATCQCGSTEFYLRVDAYGDKWKKIIGTQCVNCKEKIDWIIDGRK